MGTTSAGKYLIFTLDDEGFGLKIAGLREITGYMEITAIPHTPEHIKGVINLRGTVIPIIDLRLKLGMKEVEPTDQTCIIIVETNAHDHQLKVGIVIDHVQEIVDIGYEQIKDSPAASPINTEFVLGLGNVDSKSKILLDIDKVLKDEDFSFLDEH